MRTRKIIIPEMNNSLSELNRYHSGENRDPKISQ